ncbi:electron transfer flavoprotein subunit beta/FixA family protein [Paraburkholderia diazotrophica]|uniref:Electron transfer flavoprotein subunit beta n=1 Tax=Paraburkholderia diazotrophica TaxID=667676 RepID=A0A1H6YI45_9BURK|nr:electron transfer flavoprotein subunit beta/FixA family protein [Paraburkholderia diazotrophica]SEJ38637.1 electron transfer flavoprotein beta subunit [Paraburkholderia diazotrophica]
MKILVAIKQVASLDEDFELRDDDRDVEADFHVFDLNEWDHYALEQALLLKEAGNSDIEVVVVTVGPERADEELRKCLAKGADRAIRIWSDELEEADSVGVARALAALARREAPDMIFAGVQASDHAYGATGMALAGLLDWPHAAVVAGLEYTPGAGTASARRELEGGAYANVTVQCPAVLTLQLGINTPRYASLRGIKQAASRPIETVAPDALGLSADETGPRGSLSRIRRVYVPELGRAQMIDGTPAEQAARLAGIIKELRGEA